MKTIRVLLFDLDPETESGAALHGLLQTSPVPFVLKHTGLSRTARPTAARRLTFLLARFSPDLAFVIFGSDSSALLAELFTVFRVGKTARPVIAVVNSGEPVAVAQALYQGANDFLIPPFRAQDVFPRIWRWVQEARQEDPSLRLLKEELGLKQFVGDSPAFLAEIKKIPAFARCDASILIAGETGTGKEICARAIHCLSPRASRPFVAVNCGAIPAELVENELFGHQPGAFTGAISSSRGLIAEADGGTLFLDEVDSLPLLAQVKLLRFLQEKEFRPLGSQKTCRADVRVVAAGNVNLEEAVRADKFRQDLYYRLNVITITLPPLRQREGDVPLLARYFIAKFTTERGRAAKSLTPAAMQKLVLYQWPGNVRELENIIERSVVLSKHAIIQGNEIFLPLSAAATGNDSFQALKAIAVAQFEQQYVRQLLEANEGNVTKAAEASGKDRRSFQRLMSKRQGAKPGRAAPSPPD